MRNFVPGLLFVVATTYATAQENDAGAFYDGPPPRTFSVTASLLWPLAGLYDFSVEYRPMPLWGFVANTMLGQSRGVELDGTKTSRGSFRAGRGQVRRYLDNGGTHLAGEVSYWRIEDGRYSSGNLDDNIQQWRTALLIGHKVVSRSGFTLDLQGGAYYAFLESDTDPENGFGLPRIGPIVRANLGWSF